VPEVPTFDTVHIQKTGEAVIAGRAEAGADVVVKLDGKEIGRTTANADGAFVVVPDQPLPAGSGALTIEALGKGESTPIVSEQSVAVIVPAGQPAEALVAVVSPNAPTRILQKPEPQPEPAAASSDPAAKPATLVSIDAVDYDTNGNIVFSGKGDPGNTARIYVDNAMVGDAAVGGDGRWSFSGTASIAPGNHTLRVDGLDGEGKVVNRVEVPFFREDQNKVAEAAPAETTVAQTEPPPAAPADEQAASQPAAEAPSAEAPATPDTAAPAKPKQGRVVIQPGNNLWHISRVLYGSGAKYTMLYEANKDQIRDPNRIYPGQVFNTPEVAPKAETIDPKRREPLKPEENEGVSQ
jgi:nucleoid-associated protein YgaU